MRCSKCGADNREGRKFCAKCGGPLLQLCPKCGASNEPGEDFCGECGCALLSDGAGVHSPPLPSSAILTRVGGERAGESAPPLGERRHLTVLFCDLVNSTEIAARLDPEEWRDILARYQQVAAEAVARFEGHVAQYLGDGVLALFGYPTAHENDAERAVRTGLAIIERVTALNAGHDAERLPALAARVGIHAGPVVVGDSDNKSANVFGDTPNMAARVQAAAERNSVVVSAAVHQLVSGRFVIEDRGRQRIKGIEEPLQLYGVIRPSDVQGRLQAAVAVRALTPFIGRDDEMSLLMNRWGQALQRKPQVILISGEGGIGKSRLVHHFHEQIAGRPYKWVEGLSSPFFQNTPFYPVIGIFRELQAQYHNVPGQPAQGRQRRTRLSATDGTNGHSGNVGVSGKKEELETRSGPWHQLGLKRDVAVAMVGLNLSTGRGYTPSVPPPRERLLATLVEWVLGVAHIVPLIIAIEDLHWADPSTLELLQLLAEQAGAAPLMFLFTARPEFRTKWPPQAHHTQVTLGPLGAHNARTMVLQVGEQKALAEETIRTVVERTGGVPLFIEELTRVVLENDKVELAGREIPATLHDSLMERLDRVGAARESLQLAAVLGLEFTYEFLLAVTPLNEKELGRHLVALTEAGLLYAVGLPLGASYKFKHALIREAAYEALLKSRRRELHSRIAQTIDEKFPEQVAGHPEILAHHYTEAGRVREAIRYWRKAGLQAIERSANVEAIVQLRRGLELLKTLPPTPERQMEEAELQIALTTPLFATAGYTATEGEEASSRALELCRGLGGTPRLFAALGGLESIYFNRGELEIGLELCKQMLHLAKSQQDTILFLWSHYAMGFCLARRGALKSARDHLQRSISLYDRRRAGMYGFVQDPGPSAMGQLSHVLHSLGFAQRALATSQEGLAQARNLSHPFTLALVLGYAAALHWRRGEKLTAYDLWREEAALCADQGFKALLASASLRMGFAEVEEGRAADGILKMYESLASLSDSLGIDKPTGLVFLALALGKVGQFDEGLARIEEALTLTKRTPKFSDLPTLYMTKGQLVLMKNRTALSKAKQNFSSAVEIARNQQAKSFELAATIQLARVLRGQGHHDRARSILKKIYDWFTEGFDTADLQDAKGLLDELSVSP